MHWPRRCVDTPKPRIILCTGLLHTYAFILRVIRTTALGLGITHVADFIKLQTVSDKIYNMRRVYKTQYYKLTPIIILSVRARRSPLERVCVLANDCCAYNIIIIVCILLFRIFHVYFLITNIEHLRIINYYCNLTFVFALRQSIFECQLTTSDLRREYF